LSAPVIFTLANDLTKMQIDASVAEADVGIISEGYDVDFTVDAYPYQTFHGQVFQIRNSSTTVQNVVTYDTVITVKNDDLKLRPGMTASLFIIVAKHQNVLKMPNGAMRFHPPDVAASTGTPVKEKHQKEGGKRAGEHRSGHAAEPPQIERTVYVLRGDKPDGKPVPVKIKTGINDGIFTEVVEGLKEGDTVVTGTNTPEPETVVNNKGPLGNLKR
jgi:HlyD family secretion protein